MPLNDLNVNRNIALKYCSYTKTKNTTMMSLSTSHFFQEVGIQPHPHGSFYLYFLLIQYQLQTTWITKKSLHNFLQYMHS